MKRLLTVLAAAITFAAGLTALTAPVASAADIRACDKGGTNPQDQTIAGQLNPKLTKDMRGRMGAYEVSCARVIVQAIKERKLPERAAVIAITTVIVETHIENINGGDRDSVGLYQQRDGWGSAPNRLDAEWATNAFLDEMIRFYPNNKWHTGDIGDICQAVQRSGYPDRYAVQVSDAQIIANALWSQDTAPSSMPGVSSVSRADGSIDVFATTTDYRLKHRNFSAGKWSCWSTLPGNAKIKGDPAAVVSGNGNRIDVFAQGIDNRLKKLTWIAGQQWYDWADLGTYAITSSPAVTMRYDTGFDVFARNAANKIVYRHFSIADGWVNDWSGIGDNWSTVTATSAPAAVASADGTRMNVFTRAPDGSLLSVMWTSGAGWYNWADRGGNYVGRPAVTTRGGTSLDLYLRHNDSSLVQWYSPDGADFTSYKPQDFGGYITTSPTATTWGNQRMDVFSRNSNGDLIQKFWTAGNNWTPYIGLGPIGAPAC
ncbi:hypothetical protein OG205_45225 [Lentzea sp. NBC_00516]|uniref:hypothetical protein n=1 Tax=Lentzea sp. NBC_00516 TaxID=2903582 RepID=UPI002E80B131|nr:hypothetical protein [Lentzea sp. NBC_00516]WUD25144.1 hypothetical protein OG205_45225 [Lentzea sp. NBC_00516]